MSAAGMSIYEVEWNKLPPELTSDEEEDDVEEAAAGAGGPRREEQKEEEEVSFAIKEIALQEYFNANRPSSFGTYWKKPADNLREVFDHACGMTAGKSGKGTRTFFEATLKTPFRASATYLRTHEYVCPAGGNAYNNFVDAAYKALASPAP